MNLDQSDPKPIYRQGTWRSLTVFYGDKGTDTILILNDDKDAERRSAEGDRKALCSPPQRRNPFAAYQRDDLETD